MDSAAQTPEQRAAVFRLYAMQARDRGARTYWTDRAWQLDPDPAAHERAGLAKLLVDRIWRATVDMPVPAGNCGSADCDQPPTVAIGRLLLCPACLARAQGNYPESFARYWAPKVRTLSPVWPAPEPERPPAPAAPAEPPF